MVKANEKDLQFLEKKLGIRWSILSSVLLGRVTQLGSTLHSELEG